MKKHFVTFFSPGTFIAEQTTKPIESWDVWLAVQMSKDVLERYDAKPYGFRFTTRERGDDDLDSVVVDTSPMYYLGGKVETLDDLIATGDPNNRILISNMRSNGWNRVITNENSWTWTQHLEDDDVVLEMF